MVPSELGLLAQAPIFAASQRSRVMQPDHSARRSTGGAASAPVSVSRPPPARGATPRSEQAVASRTSRSRDVCRISHLRCSRKLGRAALAAGLPGHRQLVELLEGGELGVAVLVGLVA